MLQYHSASMNTHVCPLALGPCPFPSLGIALFYSLVVEAVTSDISIVKG